MAVPADKATSILVVDDEPLVCDSIRRLLLNEGFAVQTATSGEAALALFQQARFGLTIVDYKMPGMDGDKLAAAIKALDQQQPVVMITAYPETLESSGKRIEAVDLVLSKPFSAQEMRQAIAKLLRN